jgi:DeoR/GlpR family transcriptional regulator of sugar metabolism
MGQSAARSRRTRGSRVEGGWSFVSGSRAKRADTGMLPKERRNRILELLERRGRLSVRELTREFTVSAPTLYKDIEALERDRRVETSYGEIRLADHERYRHDFFDRLQANRSGKVHIARTAARLVHSGDTLFLDASTTTFYLCDALKARGFGELTLVTNSLFIPVEFLMHPSFRVIGLGGVLDRETAGFAPAHPERYLERLHADISFFSAAAVDPTLGVMDAYILNDVRIKELFFENADRTVCLADSSKFHNRGTVNWIGFDRLRTIVTDPGVEPQILARLREQGVEVQL